MQESSITTKEKPAPKLILLPGEVGPDREASLFRMKVYYNRAHHITGTQAQSDWLYSVDYAVEREIFKTGRTPMRRLSNGKTEAYADFKDWRGFKRLFAFADKLAFQGKVWYVLIVHNQIKDSEGRGLAVFTWQNTGAERQFLLPQQVYNPTYGHGNSQTEAE